MPIEKETNFCQQLSSACSLEETYLRQGKLLSCEEVTMLYLPGTGWKSSHEGNLRLYPRIDPKKEVRLESSCLLSNVNDEDLHLVALLCDA